MGICDKRVVIVTGAGGGLGLLTPAYSLAKARRCSLTISIPMQRKRLWTISSQPVVGSRESADITNYESSGEAIAQAIETLVT